MLRRWFVLFVLLIAGPEIILAAASAVSARKSKSTPVPPSHNVSFDREIKPLLQRYCYACHGEKKKGELDLRTYKDEKSLENAQAVFEKVLKNLQAHEMPPENKPQPTLAERELITRWVTERFFPCDCENPDPGRVTIRRLNRVEYNNTIRDLVGVNFQPAADFPQDDTGYGFDNIGDALSLSPVLLEKYLTAAEKILDTAIVTGPRTNGLVQRFEAEKLESTAPGGPFGDYALELSREGEAFVEVQLPAHDEYILRARAFGQQAGPEPARMEFRIDGKAVKVFDVTAVENAPTIYETRVTLPPGKKRVAAAYINNYVRPNDPDPSNRDRNLIIDYLEVVGSIKLPPTPLPESHKRIFVCSPVHTNAVECARMIIDSFARRAFRRPLTQEEIGRFLKLFKAVDTESPNFENSIKVTLQAVLVSPHFLFRGELQPEPGNPKRIHQIDDFALASRLSYFLWSSMPDDELLRQAKRGTLHRNLESEVKRMLRDPKSAALVENFAGQWLQLRNLDLVMPDAKLFPDFDEDLRKAMRRETEMFFGYILREDRSILEFIDANYTFANERLAQFYGIRGPRGEEFQRVSLKGTRRGGLLTQASILTITSNPTRTSPVKRGKWVLENLLGTPPPPPPANVPELKEGKESILSGTLRQRMEQHRQDPNCASCHARMDPIGFGFENYDAIGAWRQKDGEFPIDASGKLVSGESFNGASEFEGILLDRKRDEFTRCLTQKMLTYALGRGLEYYDQCAVDQIAKGLAKRRYKFSSLVMEVIKSTPFQMRRGEDVRVAQISP